MPRSSARPAAVVLSALAAAAPAAAAPVALVSASATVSAVDVAVRVDGAAVPAGLLWAGYDRSAARCPAGPAAWLLQAGAAGRWLTSGGAGPGPVGTAAQPVAGAFARTVRIVPARTARNAGRWRVCAWLSVSGAPAAAAAARFRLREDRLHRGVPQYVGPRAGTMPVRPRALTMSPTETLRGIRWRRWGAPRAIGTGRYRVVTAGGPVTARAHVQALRPGTCFGRPAYTRIVVEPVAARRLPEQLVFDLFDPSRCTRP